MRRRPTLPQLIMVELYQRACLLLLTIHRRLSTPAALLSLIAHVSVSCRVFRQTLQIAPHHSHILNVLVLRFFAPDLALLKLRALQHCLMQALNHHGVYLRLNVVFILLRTHFIVYSDAVLDVLAMQLVQEEIQSILCRQKELKMGKARVPRNITDRLRSNRFNVCHHFFLL